MEFNIARTQVISFANYSTKVNFGVYPQTLTYYDRSLKKQEATSFAISIPTIEVASLNTRIVSQSL